MQSPKTPSASIIPFSPQPTIEPKYPKHKMHDGLDPVRVKDPIFINLDDDIDENVIHDENVTPVHSDSEYEYVDVDNHLSNEFSKALILAPRQEQRGLGHEHSPCLDLVIAPSAVLDVPPLACFLPSRNIDQQDRGVDDVLD